MYSFTQPGAVVSLHVHDKRISWIPGKSKSKPTSVAPPPGLPKPEPSFVSCSDEQKQMVEMATAYAKKYVGIAVLESEKIWALGPYIDRGGFYKTWFGEYSKDNAEKVMNTLRGMEKNFPFMGFDYDCSCDEMVAFEVGRCTLQLWDPLSVTDKFLVQPPRAVKSGSADASGASTKTTNRFDLSVWLAWACGQAAKQLVWLLPIAWL